MKNEARYVVFDGMDGSGKGTQMRLLEEKLSHRAVFTREPGGTPFAEEIRKIVRDNPLAGESTALNNFLLFWAAREELQEKVVTPTLASGMHVFSDRGDSSTFAFQICGEEHRELMNLFMSLRMQVFGRANGRRSPDLYIVFDLPAEVARERALQDAGRTTNHFDVRDIGYYERVRSGFHEFANYESVKFVDANRSPEAVHHSVLVILATQLIIPEAAVFIA